jgi:integrase/recombinase XerC
MELKKAFDDFISFIKHEENLSLNTLSAYSADVLDFIKYLEQQTVSDISAISHFHIRTYLSGLYSDLDKRSIARRPVL